MKIQIIAAGKPSLEYARRGIEEYRKRLTRYVNLDLTYVKAGESESVSADLLSRSEKTCRIAMDERGENMTTAAWVEHFNNFEMDGTIKQVSFLIGASDGHTPELRDQSTHVWSLSKLTMQHELALTVLLEQIYRVYTIKRGEPYHR